MRRWLALALIAGLSACEQGEPPRSVSSRPVASGSAATPAPASGTIGDYVLTLDAAGTLAVEARLNGAGTADFGIGSPEFVKNAEVATEGAAFAPMGKDLMAPPCASGACRIRYRFELKTAASRLDDIDSAIEESNVIMSPPSTWLLVPKTDMGKRVRFRVVMPPGQAFVTGVFHAADTKDAYEINLDDLETSPYSAFGALRVKNLQYAEGSLDVAIGPGHLGLPDERLLSWTQDSVKAIESYFGQFPMSHAALLLIPGRGRAIGEGRTLAGGGGSIFIRVGESASERGVKNDWVMVHEMVHLSFPSLPRGHQWAEEGIATYVEPWARVRAGTLSEQEAWRGLIEGLPNGQPAAGDQGLDRTHTWGRTYWGGALFWFVADVEIRKKTNNQKGLEQAVRAILEGGGNDAVRWPIETMFATGDKATGTTVLTDLYAKWSKNAVTVDLRAIENDLGVSVVPGSGVFIDEKAPSAAIRRAIATGH